MVTLTITDLRQHNIILRKSWINKNELLLNIKNDSIVFRKASFKTMKKLTISAAQSFSQFTSKIFSHSVSSDDDNTFNLCSVEVTLYTVLVYWENTQIFALSMKDIDRQLTVDWECQTEELNLSSAESVNQYLNNVYQVLSSKYHESLNVFDCSQISKLSSHYLYNLKIELISDATSSQSWVYCMSLYKLQKVKKYLNENLSKRFITLSKTVYFSSVLFTLKLNSDLRFCVNYWKLNAFIKQNCYLLSLIEKIIEKILNCKHLTHLDICHNIDSEILMFRLSVDN